MDTKPSIFQALVTDAPSSVRTQVLGRAQSVAADVRSMNLPALNEASLQQIDVRPPPGLDSVEMIGCYQNIEQALRSRPNPIVQIVTPTKSAANVDIAHSIAWVGSKMLGRRVLLIDAAGVQPEVKPSANRPAETSWPIASQLQKMRKLSDVVSGTALVEDAIVKDANSRLFFAKLDMNSFYSHASSAQFDIRAFLDGLRPHFDMILLTPSPVVENPLAAVLTSTVDGTVVVLQADRSRLKPVMRAVRILQAGGAPILGVILSDHRSYTPKWLQRFLAF